MEAAAQFLAVRSRSVSETRRRLLDLGYAEGVTDEVLARLGRLGYLDDHAFALAWVESRDRSRPRGEAALRQELRRKGVDEAIVRAVLGLRANVAGSTSGPARWSANPDASPGDDAPWMPAGSSVDRVAAARLLDRRAAALAREPDRRKRRQKAYALLARNGFDPGVCRDVSARVVGGAQDEDTATADEGP
jgi:regulatory protein